MEQKQKKHKKQGSHGAVSVFLAIILVPCLVFTCVFGDLSRVQLSKAVTESAGDLALYSLLARYDEDLKEYYGLVGSCQDIDAFYQVTETYFTGMLQAEGVSGEGCELFVEYLNELQSEGYSDFLRGELTGVKVEAAANGAMGDNAALIEDGIVEFMKYRGPIEITTGLLDRFTDLDIGNTVTEAEKNKEVTDKKQEYAEEQGTLLKMAFYSYLAIREYEKAQESSGLPSREDYAAKVTDLNDIRDDLKGVTALVAKYYFPGSENLKAVALPEIALEAHPAQKEDVGEKGENENGDTVYYISSEKFQELTKDLEADLAAIGTAAEAVANQCNAVGSYSSGANEVVYCLKMQEAMESGGQLSAIQQTGDRLITAYGKLKAAGECEAKPDDGSLPSDWKDQLARYCTRIEEARGKYLAGAGSTGYGANVTAYMSMAGGVANKVQQRSYTFTSKFTGGSETVNGFASAVSNRLEHHKQTLKEQIERLELAIEGGLLEYNGKHKMVWSLDMLSLQAEEFTQARNDWGAAAKEHKDSTDYAQEEYDLYQGAAEAAEGSGSNSAEVEGEKIAAKITPESVAQLKSRLVNIRNDMQGYLNALNKFSYGDRFMDNFPSGEELIAQARKGMAKNTDLSLSAAEDAARGHAAALIEPNEGDVYTAPQKNNETNGNDPRLAANTPELYAFLKKQFQNKEADIEDEVSKNDDREEEYEKKADDAKKGANNVNGAYVSQKGEDLTDIHEGNKVSLLSGLNGVVDTVQKLTSGSGDELRDQIYVCEYIMDMFSYSSFENEGKYRLMLDDGTGVTYRDFPYSAKAADWEKEDARSVMENQSLTNRPITKANNHAHLGEVEYILYGNASINRNLASSYGNIFAIREMMNLVSGFANFYSGGNATANTIAGIAAAVAGATAGVVPVPVTKCVLILTLATLESAKDLERLQKGGRVEFYKAGDEDWVYSLGSEEGGVSASFSTGDKDGPEDGMYYSDYLYIFLLMGLTNDDTYSSMLLRVGDLIQANMRRTEGNQGFSLAKTQCYFQLSGTMRVKPLMLTLPIVDMVEGGADLRQNTDWCTYQVNVIRGYS